MFIIFSSFWILTKIVNKTCEKCVNYDYFPFLSQLLVNAVRNFCQWVKGLFIGDGFPVLTALENRSTCFLIRSGLLQNLPFLIVYLEQIYNPLFSCFLSRKNLRKLMNLNLKIARFDGGSVQLWGNFCELLLILFNVWSNPDFFYLWLTYLWNMKWP